MNKMNILRSLKFLCLFVFALMVFGENFGWFKSFSLLTSAECVQIRNVSLIAYGIFYIVKLKHSIKQKDTEISKLKTKLIAYGK